MEKYLEENIVSADIECDENENEEMYEHFAVTVDKGQSMMRLDKYLTIRLENTSRNRIQTAADGGNIIVNGKPQKSSYKIKPLDQISIVLPYPRRKEEIVPENIPLDIVYEDDDIIVVNKHAGMVVHPGVGNHNGKSYALCFHHIDKADGDVWIVIRGVNQGGFSLAFVKDKETVIDAEFKCLPQDDEGTLIQYIEEIEASA